MYEDVHESRILGGLHDRFSMNAGRFIGGKVARQLTKKYYTPLERSLVRRTRRNGFDT